MPVMAYSPIGQAGRLLKNKALLEVARRHDATPAQIASAWALRQPGVIAIPKRAISITSATTGEKRTVFILGGAAANERETSQASGTRSSGRFQRRQIDFAVLARKCHFPPAVALVLLHARDAMVVGIVHLDFPIAGIDSQPLFVAEECVAGFVLAAAGIGILTELFRPPALRRLHRLHR